MTDNSIQTSKEVYDKDLLKVIKEKPSLKKQKKTQILRELYMLEKNIRFIL